MTDLLQVLGQAVPISTNPPTSVLAAVILLGSFIVSGLLFALRTLWQDNKSQRRALTVLGKENSDWAQNQLRESLKVTIDATNRMHESEKAVEAATLMMSTVATALAASQLRPEQGAEIAYWLRQLREAQNRS